MSVTLLTPHCEVGLEQVAEMDVSTYMGSTQFINTILPTSLSTVLYNRCNFKEESLKHHSLQGVSYVNFRSSISRDHPAYMLQAAVKYIKKYVEQKYLKEIAIVIQSALSGATLERYTFRLKYKSGTDGSFPRGRTAENVCKKFLSEINENLTVDNKYEEADIKLHYEWAFYSIAPLNELLLHFQPGVSCDDRKKQIMMLAKLKTKFHSLDVFVSLGSSEESEAAEASARLDRDLSNTGDGNFTLPSISDGITQRSSERLRLKRTHD